MSIASVFTLDELTRAIESEDVTTIQVKGAITVVKSIHLKPGVKLEGASDGAALHFKAGHDGVGIAKDNTISNLELWAEPQRSAVYLQSPESSFGRLTLENLRVTGCVALLPNGGNSGSGDVVTVNDIHITSADARSVTKGPIGFGVEIVPAAFTLLNRRSSTNSSIKAELRNISAGSQDNPISGTGILIGGTPGGGEVAISLLKTGEIHSNSGLPPGTADRISGGVFVVQGAHADEVCNTGTVSTYGTNDMVLDNWGVVDTWSALADCTSYGPSSIGFVQLGQIGTLSIEGVLETHGAGSCGFNAGEVKSGPSEPSKGPEAGEVREASFNSIVTRGDGAIGVQISVPEGNITVKNGIRTFGSEGESLARGVVMKLAATALSVKPGGAAKEIIIDGGLITHGKGVQAMELLGQVETLRISGNVGPA